MQFVADDGAVAAIDFHQARLHQPIDVRIEAAQAGRQLRGEHVHGPLREVHRRAALVRLPVERPVLGDVARDVRDMHAEPEVPVRQPIDRDRVVEIARVFAVDGDRRPVAEVGPAPAVALAHAGAQPAGLGNRVLTVFVRQVVLVDDDGRVDAGLLEPAQHLDDPSQRGAGGRRKSGDLHRDHFTRRRAAALAGPDLHVHDQAPVERDHESVPRIVDVEAAHDGRRRALEDPHDASLGPPVAAGVLDAHDDAIAVHGLIQVRAGDIDARRPVLERRIGIHEGEPAGIRRDASHHQVHSIRQAESLAPDFDEGPRGHQRTQPALERRPLLARDAQHAQQLLHRGGMVHPLPDELQ